MQMFLHSGNYRNIFTIKRIKLMKIPFGKIIFPCNFYNILKKSFLSVSEAVVFSLKNNPHSKIMDFLYSLMSLIELSSE